MLACQNLLIGFKPKRQEPEKASTMVESYWRRRIARCVSACPVPRVAGRLGVNVAGVLPFEESRAFRRWVSTSRPVFMNAFLSSGRITTYAEI